MGAPPAVGLLCVGGTLLAWTAAIIPVGSTGSEQRVAPIESPTSPQAHVQAHVQAPVPPQKARPPQRARPAAAPIVGEPSPAIPRQRVETEEPELPALPPEQDELAQQFELEGEDGSWTQAMTAALLGHFAASGIAEHALRRVDCRATLCRVEVKVEGPAQLVAMSRLTVDFPGSQISVVSTEPMDDGTFASLFVTRSAAAGL